MADAIAHVAIGTPIPDREMATPSGGTERALSPTLPSVLLFVRPGQERSRAMLSELAGCRKALGERPLRWAVVVSGSGEPDRAGALVRDSGFEATILVDRGDELYGSLGMAMHPVLVLIGRERELAAFEPYRSVSFCDAVTARIRHYLGEIGADELRAALNPQTPTASPEAVAARRYHALAEALLRAGNPDKALEMAGKALERDARAARTHVLVGEIRASKGDCAEASKSFELALSIDSATAGAREGLARCAAQR